MSRPPLKDDTFLRALLRQKTARTPVWADILSTTSCASNTGVMSRTGGMAGTNARLDASGTNVANYAS